MHDAIKCRCCKQATPSIRIPPRQSSALQKAFRSANNAKRKKSLGSTNRSPRLRLRRSLPHRRNRLHRGSLSDQSSRKRRRRGDSLARLSLEDRCSGSRQCSGKSRDADGVVDHRRSGHRQSRVARARNDLVAGGSGSGLGEDGDGGGTDDAGESAGWLADSCCVVLRYDTCDGVDFAGNC